MPTFKSIPDAMIEAFKPVTGRLMTRILRNMQAVAIHNLLRPGIVSGTTTSATFVTVATLRVFCPYAGPVRIVIEGSAAKDPADGPATMRLRDLATTSVSNTGSMSANTDDDIRLYTLDFTSVADTIREIEFQAQLDAGSSGVIFEMRQSPTLGGDFMKVNK